ncbi:MAG: Fe-S cluster assembly protein HesB [Candidatus Heimdallarchaeota archaeon]|nr:Fe-S cluster assembly protein HesB [Candidatus Heimdallarchaeota archaeon]
MSRKAVAREEEKNYTKRKVKAFQEKIFQWWETNRRKLPWRTTTDPYQIMVSEVMLQQTQVSRVIIKFEEFIKTFPTLQSLADAKKSDLLRVWSGLGYNRRALWLQEAAQEIVKKGSFPSEIEELEALKGIGPYTARAILIFAFNKDLATVDTNIRRILISEGFATEETPESSLFLLAEKLLPKGRSRDWHNALMDYGARVLSATKTKIRPLTRQTTYNKSQRYFRGQILKYLIEHSKATIQQLQEKTALPEEDLHMLMEKLAKDGLIIKRKNHYALPD